MTRHPTIRSGSGAAFFAALLLGACTSGEGDPVCAPGQSAKCPCAFGRLGTRTCRDDASGFTPCDCGPAGPLLYEELREVAAANPDITALVDYGDSYDKVTGDDLGGCDLLALKIATDDTSEPKPVFFVVAGYHGDEVVSSDVAMRFAAHLVDEYGRSEDATWVVDHLETWVIPVVNPDSLGLRRHNANGVDLNRNHSFHWEPGDEHGSGPASEPEVRAVEELARSVIPDQRPSGEEDPAPLDTSGLLVSLHAPFSQVLWPWAWSGSPAPNEAELSAIGRRLADRADYQAGQTFDGAYAMPGCATDWVYGTFGIPALLVEIGPSNGPPPSQVDAEVWPKMKELLLEAAQMAPAPYRAARGRDAPETR